MAKTRVKKALGIFTDGFDVAKHAALTTLHQHAVTPEVIVRDIVDVSKFTVPCSKCSFQLIVAFPEARFRIEGKLSIFCRRCGHTTKVEGSFGDDLIKEEQLRNALLEAVSNKKVSSLFETKAHIH